MKWIVLLCIVIVCLIKITPNPFSRQYDDMFIEQSLEWSRIGELVQAKDIVRFTSLRFFLRIGKIASLGFGARYPIQSL